MNLKELTVPVRIYWDLDGRGAGSADHLKICQEIIDLKILFLSLRDTAVPSGPAVLDIIDKLADQHIALSLTVSPSALTDGLIARLAGSGLKMLLLDAATTDEVRTAIEEAGRCRDAGLVSGISFSAGKDNYRNIPEVVSSCLRHGIADLVLPIQRIAPAGDCFYIPPDEAGELAARLAKTDYRKLRITIHDPFLWQVFYPEADYHEGGCQAANSMIYITAWFKVYPCPAMPAELGDLREESLREILVSAKKRDLRQTLLSPPDDCGGCDQAAKCLGGCRGRALAAAGSLNRRDPGCPY